MHLSRSVILSMLCAAALCACQTTGNVPNKTSASNAPPPPQSGIEITGGISTTMKDEPIVVNDPNVQVYSTEGPAQNPLLAERMHSVLDNTTSGGYTVFDNSVTVYPLPGDDVPGYLPSYAVPPLESQNRPENPQMGQPLSLTSAGMLPPVPNVDVSQKDIPRSPSASARAPLSLTAPEPLTMQPPSEARPPLPSPFIKAPSLTQDEPDAPASETPQKMMTAGRRSPTLTGY